MSDEAPDPARPEEHDEGNVNGETWDAPNQQVVHEDTAPPWSEGTGGDAVDPVPQVADAPEAQETPEAPEAQETPVAPQAQETYDPGAHTVEEVRAYVEQNPQEADAVRAAEESGKARTTLLDHLSGD